MIRNAYLKKVEKRLRELDLEVEYLRRRAADASSEAKTELFRQVDSLRDKASAARDRIRDVREAGAESWGRLKGHADAAVDEARKELDEALRKIRKTGSANR